MYNGCRRSLRRQQKIFVMKNYYLAIDIGASSGRHIVGWEEGGKIMTEEVYRFKNGVEERGGSLVWNTEALFYNVKEGIKRALAKFPRISSLAIDTWGVDYVLMNGDSAVLPCAAYRDDRTADIIDEVHARISFDELYKRTGIQFQPFNTIYQLYEDKKRGRLYAATDFLMIPEYLNYLLTGVIKKEYTNATTTGLLNAQTGDWDWDIIQALGLPNEMFGKLYAPGESVGKLKSEVAAEVGGQIEVVLCASHDTASAVEGIPMRGNQPYISSGTWSLLGIKSPVAHTDESSLAGNWSNEGGVGYVRYQKNIMGMWVVNGLKSELCPDKPFGEIIKEARASKFAGVADINNNIFLSPQSMVGAFDTWFRGGEGPKTFGDYFNCAFLSLAHSYSSALKELEENTGIKAEELYIVGGGAKNEFLNKLTEDFCKVKVIALPIEATAIGNLKIQIERGLRQ